MPEGLSSGVIIRISTGHRIHPLISHIEHCIASAHRVNIPFLLTVLALICFCRLHARAGPRVHSDCPRRPRVVRGRSRQETHRRPSAQGVVRKRIGPQAEATYRPFDHPLERSAIPMNAALCSSLERSCPFPAIVFRSRKKIENLARGKRGSLSRQPGGSGSVLRLSNTVAGACLQGFCLRL